MGLLDAEGPLVDRLKAFCPSATGNVFSADDLAGVKENSQVTPAIHVVLHSYRPVEDAGGSDNRWIEIWLVIAVVKNVRQGVGSRAVRKAAGAMLQEIIGALDGWKCPGTTSLLRAVPPPNPLIAAGFGYFPLAFQTQVVTAGVQPDY